MIKTMNSKMTMNSQLSTTEPKNKNKLSKQLEQEQNHRNGDHVEGYQWGEGGGRMEGKVQGINSDRKETGTQQFGAEGRNKH